MFRGCCCNVAWGKRPDGPPKKNKPKKIVKGVERRGESLRKKIGYRKIVWPGGPLLPTEVSFFDR